jgi:hypothetical protein
MSDGIVEVNAREKVEFARKMSLMQIEGLFDRLGSMRRALENGVSAEYLEADMSDVVHQAQVLLSSWTLQATFEALLK